MPHAVNYGQIQVYTGNGKGKTTAALGLAVRAAGHGVKVAIVYFDKGGDFYSERNILSHELKGKIRFFVTGHPRMNAGEKGFRFNIDDQDKQEAQRGLDIARDIIYSSDYDMVVLDELCTVIGLGMVKSEAIVYLLKNKPVGVEIVLTGRNCPQEIIDCANMVTEMKLVKHYFYKGVVARQGIEY